MMLQIVKDIRSAVCEIEARKLTPVTVTLNPGDVCNLRSYASELCTQRLSDIVSVEKLFGLTIRADLSVPRGSFDIGVRFEGHPRPHQPEDI